MARPERPMLLPMVGLQRVLLLVAILGHAMWLGAQSSPFYFDRLGKQQGLSHNTISAVLKDRQGFIWVGTEDGLNRYDGYSFGAFRHHPDDSLGLPDSFISDLSEDSDGNIWIGCSNAGLSCFDPRKGSFRNFRANPDRPHVLAANEIVSVQCIGNWVWVSTFGAGIGRLDRRTGAFESIVLPFGKASLQRAFRDPKLYADPNGNLWVGVDGAGLFRIRLQGDSIVDIHHFYADSGGLPSNRVGAITSLPNGHLLVSVADKLVVFDPQKVACLPEASWKAYSDTERILSLSTDSTGNWWLGTSEGLYLKSPQGAWRMFRHDPGDVFSLSQNAITCLFLDPHQVLWIGTAAGGLNKVDTHRKAFEHYKHQPNDGNSLASNLIRSMAADSQYLWVGTTETGFDRMHLATRRFSNFQLRIPGSNQRLRHVAALHLEADGTAWVGGWRGGLFHLRIDADDRLHVLAHWRQSEGRDGLSSDIVQSILRDRYGRLWVGTQDGLNVSTDDRHFRHFYHHSPEPSALSDSRIQSAMVSDHKGNLWFGTWNGLHRVLPPRFRNDTSVRIRVYQQQASVPNALNDNRVIALHVDRHDQLWVGTYGAGLHKLQIETRPDSTEQLRFRQYSVEHGLVNQTIYSIQEDALGRLWLSTNEGLALFDPHTERFRTYFQEDGLQSNQFYWGAGTSNGTLLFFGGIQGFNLFRPQAIESNPHPAFPVVTRVEIDNASAGMPGLPRLYLSSDTVVMHAGTKSLSIEFAALHYSSPSKNLYAYRLEGFDERWVHTNATRRYVSYTNLAPGFYTFWLRVANADGEWSNRVFRLQVRVEARLWQHAWFHVAWVAVLLVLVWLSYRLRTARLAQQKRVLIHEVALRTAELKHLNSNLLESNNELAFKNQQLNNFNIELREKQEEIELLNEELRQSNIEIQVNNHALKEQAEELAQALSNLRSAQNQLVQSEKMAALGVLTAGVAHEINNPINFINASIFGLASAFEVLTKALEHHQSLSEASTPADWQRVREAEQELELDFYLEGIQELFQHIRDGVERTTSIVRSLRNLSHQDTAERQRTDLHALIDSTLVLLQHETKNRIRIHRHYDQLPLVSCYPGKLNQVFMNLITNAIQAMGESGDLHLLTKYDPAHNIVQVHIRDTGPGIAYEAQARVFDPFFTTKPVGKGTGLGLSISYSIVQEHHGSIDLFSEPGHGATFVLNLPVDAA